MHFSPSSGGLFSQCVWPGTLESTCCNGYLASLTVKVERQKHSADYIVCIAQLYTKKENTSNIIQISQQYTSACLQFLLVFCRSITHIVLLTMSDTRASQYCDCKDVFDTTHEKKKRICNYHINCRYCLKKFINCCLSIVEFIDPKFGYIAQTLYYEMKCFNNLIQQIKMQKV